MDGKIYGIPVGFTTHCLFYNKDLFDQAGAGLSDLRLDLG